MNRMFAFIGGGAKYSRQTHIHKGEKIGEIFKESFILQ
jgi:hypothetical protein